jgi:hypothetical protein
MMPMIVVVAIAIVSLREKSKIESPARNSITQTDKAKGKKPIIWGVFHLMRALNLCCLMRERNWCDAGSPAEYAFSHCFISIAIAASPREQANEVNHKPLTHTLFGEGTNFWGSTFG